MRRATEDPMEAISDMLAFSSKDWAEDREGAWLYAIVNGWGDPEDPETDAWDEVAQQYQWNAETVARLKRLHEAWDRIAQAVFNAGTDWAGLESELRELERVDPDVKAAADRVDEAFHRPDVARFLRGEA